jgi:hypothetical protein
MKFKLKYKQAGCNMVKVFEIFGKFSKVSTWSSLGCKELAFHLDEYSMPTEEAREIYSWMKKNYQAIAA